VERKEDPPFPPMTCATACSIQFSPSYRRGIIMLSSVKQNL